jgi:hypothetical protein
LQVKSTSALAGPAIWGGFHVAAAGDVDIDAKANKRRLGGGGQTL